MNYGEIPGNPGNSGEFWGNSGEFWRNSRGILAKSGEIQGNSGEFWGNQTKSFSLLFTRFHSFSKVRNTFPFWGNLIPLISPVATVKTGENSGEKKWKGIRRETWIRLPFYFVSPSPPISFNCTVLYTGLLSQKALPAYLKSKQELPFDFAPQIYISHCQPFKFNISFLARLLIFN